MNFLCGDHVYSPVERGLAWSWVSTAAENRNEVMLLSNSLRHGFSFDFLVETDLQWNGFLGIGPRSKLSSAPLSTYMLAADGISWSDLAECLKPTLRNASNLKTDENDIIKVEHLKMPTVPYWHQYLLLKHFAHSAEDIKGHLGIFLHLNQCCEKTKIVSPVCLLVLSGGKGSTLWACVHSNNGTLSA